MTLVPVSREIHANKKIRPRVSYEFARASGVLPLYGAEMGRAAGEYPVCFTRSAEGFFPGALMAIEPGNNLFVALDGQWLGSYLPAVLRRGPFSLARVEETGDWVLCLDDTSDLISEDEGAPLFAEDGQASPFLAQMSTFLADLERSRLVTLAACNCLAAHGLLAPWELRVDAGGGNVKRIEGLFRLDEAKLNAVGAEALLELRNAGALAIAYAHLFSLAKLPLIGRLADVHAQLEAQRKSMAKTELNLDHAFGIDQDDPFLFDFKK